MIFFTRLLENLINIIYKLSWTVGPYLPGTSMNTIWRGFDRQSVSILDVGGGWGEPMSFLNKKHKFEKKVNADTFLPHLKKSRREGTHDEYVLCDARHLPFKEKSFDIVLCLELIEHLPKEEGLKLASGLEEIARKQVILSTPVGEEMNPELDSYHLCSWRPAEFRELGYKVRGDGFPCIRGRLLVASTNQVLALLGYLLYPIASPFVYFFPNKAGGMTCIKQISGDS